MSVDGNGCNSQWVFKVFGRNFGSSFTLRVFHSQKNVVENYICCQKVITRISCDCEARDIFLWEDISNKSPVKRHGNFLCIEGLIAIYTCNFKNFQLVYFCWLKINLQIYQNSCIKTESKFAYFSCFTGLCLANVSKFVKLFVLTWACHNSSFVSNAATQHSINKSVFALKTYA